MKHRIATVATATALILAGAGTATAASYVGLLPGPTPTHSWTRDAPTLRTYWQDCGALVIDASGWEESPRYARWIKSLERAGWHGYAEDGMEALYAPGC